VEIEADTITIQRGYKKELIAERSSQEKRYDKIDKRKKELIKKVYMSVEELNKIN